MRHAIDLNADVGEGSGCDLAPGDAELLAVATSANIACGFHAGNPLVMRATVREAARQGVAIGAHPGYPDREGFGRRELGLAPADLAAIVLYQIGALMACCVTEGARLRHVKLHGALYHRAARDEILAEAIAEAVRSVDRKLVLLGPPDSALLRAGTRSGLITATEAFLDRAYLADGTLVPRGHAGATLDDVEAAADRAVRMVQQHTVFALDGTRLIIRPDSLCVHSDGPNPAALLRAVRTRLEREGVRIAPFAP